MRLLGGLSPGSSLLANLHARDAANRMTPAGGSMLANGAAAFAPPPPTLVLPDSASAPASAPPADAADGRTTPEPTKAQPPPSAANPQPGDGAAHPQERAATEGTDIGEVDDPNVLRNQAPGDEAPEMTLDDMAAWAADADARQAEDLAADATVRAADARLQENWLDAKHQADTARAWDDAAAAAQRAADQNAAAERVAAARADDPEGAAADDAANAQAAAQQRVDEAFFDTSEGSSNRLRDALDAAKVAKQQADAARAAADAAQAARAALVTPIAWVPDKP
jgi:hypothetical protein